MSSGENDVVDEMNNNKKTYILSVRDKLQMYERITQYLISWLNEQLREDELLWSLEI